MDIPWPFFASSLADSRYYKHIADVNATSTQQHYATMTSQLRLGKQRQVWFIPLADECGVCR